MSSSICITLDFFERGSYSSESDVAFSVVSDISITVERCLLHFASLFSSKMFVSKVFNTLGDEGPEYNEFEYVDVYVDD